MSRELIVREDSIIGAPELRHRVQVIQEVMKSVMKDQVHFGTIPGTPKPSLWKPGAEKLAMTFGISISTEIAEERIHEEEVFYRVRATATAADGRVLGATEGVCSTREKKFRWRRPVHAKEFEATPEHLRRVSWDKDGNEILQVRTEPGDLINTILQMADKRAYVGLVRKVTAASDIFAQELDDDGGGEEQAPPKEPAPAGEAAPERPADPAGPTPVLITEVKIVAKGTNPDKEDPDDESKAVPWTLWTVKTGDGKEYTTFSQTMAVAAKKAQAEKAKVQIVSTPNRKDATKSPTLTELTRVSG